jgi:hypothetical protein
MNTLKKRERKSAMKMCACGQMVKGITNFSYSQQGHPARATCRATSNVMSSASPKQAAGRSMPVALIASRQRVDPLPVATLHGRAIVAHFPMSLQATNAVQRACSLAEHIAGGLDVGTATLAGPLSSPPTRRCSPSALKAARAIHSGHLETLRAAGRARCRY